MILAPSFWRFRGALATVIGLLMSNGLILVFGIATGVIAARLLGPEDRGALGAILLWPQIFAALGLISINDALLLKLPQALNPSPVIASAAATALLLSVASVGAGLLLLPSALSAVPSAISLGAAFMVVYIPCNYLTLVFLAAEQSACRYSSFNRIRVAGPFIYLVGVCLLAAGGGLTLTTAAVVSLLANVATTVFASRGYWNLIPPVPKLREVANWLRFAKSMHLTSVLSIGSSQIDRVAVASLLDARSIGLYMVSITMPGALLGSISSTALSYLIPEICRETTREGRRTLITAGLALTWLALVGAALGLALTCPYAIPRLFGEAYGSAVLPSMLAIGAYIPFAARQVVVRVFRTLEYNRPGHLAEGLSMCVFALLVGPVQERYGLSGVCLALTAANVCSLALCAYELGRVADVAPSAWLLPNPTKLLPLMSRTARVTA